MSERTMRGRGVPPVLLALSVFAVTSWLVLLMHCVQKVPQ